MAKRKSMAETQDKNLELNLEETKDREDAGFSKENDFI